MRPIARSGAWGAQRYDRILVDAPCSATGVMRRHPDIRLLRRAADVAGLVRRQAAILAALWPLLAPGGRLLYVTCSLLPAENAQQVDVFLAAMQTPKRWNCRPRPEPAVARVYSCSPVSMTRTGFITPRCRRGRNEYEDDLRDNRGHRAPVPASCHCSPTTWNSSASR